MTGVSDTNLQLASIFKAAGDQMRLDILRIMRRDSFGVLELCKVFCVQQPSMSHHLKVLSKAGLVATRREGNSIFYRRAGAPDEKSNELLSTFFELLDRESVDEPLLAVLAEIQSNRRAQATEFFRTNAHRFREQQDLIAGYKDYGRLVVDRLVKDKDASWVEIGPGEGELLRAAATDFADVCALDVSEELLERSRENLPAAMSGKVRFLLGDTKSALEKDIHANVISCNMVLHHVPSPAEMIADMAAMLNVSGQLLITDLVQHDQDWARENCGDLWLGFAPEQLTEWANQGGLREGRSDFLALRNGFRVQVREYFKA